VDQVAGYLAGCRTAAEDLVHAEFRSRRRIEARAADHQQRPPSPGRGELRCRGERRRQFPRVRQVRVPGFATPRVVCDVPYVGKRWVHQVARYDTTLGISYWTKNYRTAIEAADALALSREYPYYDPVHLLPEEGQTWWRARAQAPELVS
jgi:hypothetical protein